MSTTSESKAHQDEEFDVLVVGAGFGGAYLLHKLRKDGFSVKVFEAASSMGGTWYWNCYPGARVDSEFSIYQFSLEEIWRDWNWKERYPGREELVSYFDYVDKKLDLRRDISFDTRVVAAQFDSTHNRWIVTTHNGRTVRPKFLVLCTGFASKPLFPDVKGLDTFKGAVHHTARWPQTGVDLAGKRVGVVGTGASGVQVIQEAGPIASHLTVFQRTPNLALPMHNYDLDVAIQTRMKEELLQHILRRRKQTFAGFQFSVIDKSLFDISPEERYLTFEDLWAKGGLNYWLGAHEDIFHDERANNEVYKFWRNKVIARIADPKMQHKLAPETPPHPFGVKRVALEQKYYEVYNRPNVDLVDLEENPMVEVTPSGVKTQDGVEHELDVLVLATGFDAITGSISQIDIKGTDGQLIGEKWKKRLSTYLGMTCVGFPNMFFVYGPHGPTAFANGPTCIEMQGDWITDCIVYMREHGKTRIEPKQEAANEWVQNLDDTYAKFLWSKGKSWYNGSNVPGKHVQSLNFTGGFPVYDRICREVAEGGYTAGFVLEGLNADA